MGKQTTKKSVQQQANVIKHIFYTATGITLLLIIATVLTGILIDNIIIPIVLGSIACFSAVLTLATLVIFLNRFKNRVLMPMFDKTADNMDKITKNNYVLESYNDSSIMEFDQINDSIKKINARYNTLVVTSSKTAVADIDLTKDPKFSGKTITIDSFFNNVSSFINVTKSFRNVFASFVYETKEYKPGEEDLAKLIDIVFDVFQDNNIVVCADTDYSLIAYIPNIDSLSILKEKLSFVQKKGIIAKFTDRATEVIPLKISASVYPYSSLDTIISDLRYAERRGEDINIYIPERDNDTQSVSTDAKKLNATSEIMERLNAAFSKGGSVESYRKEVLSCATTLSDFLGFEGMSVLVFNENIGACTQLYSHSTGDRKFSIGPEAKELLAAIAMCADKDGSFTFFKRENVTTNLGNYLDIYGIKSGHLSVIYNNGQVYGAIMFVNFTKELVLDFITRESIIVFANMFSSSLKELYNRSSIEGANARLESVLLYSGYQMYSVNKSTFSLVAASRSLSDNKGVGEAPKCYKAIYGLDKPCDDCPLLSGKNKRTNIDNKNYSYHTILANKENRENATFFLEPIDRRNIARERYDSETKLATSHNFAMRLSDKWNYELKGYVALINIANFHDIVTALGESDIHQYLRNIYEVLTAAKITTEDIFRYNQSTIAIIFGESIRDQVFNVIETIEDAFENKIGNSIKGVEVKKSYRIFNFPQTYATSFDFIRSIEVYLNSNNMDGDNNLHVVGTNIVRPASREQYILSLLNKAFENKNFDLRIQPIISKDSGIICGGEALLRLKDELTNTFFDAGEFIPVAVKSHSMNKFTNIFIEQIGRLYKTYGATLFRTGFLDRININADSSYFRDPEFLDDMAKAFTEYGFQKGFIAFEFNESDIAANQELIKESSRKVKNLNITMVCDQFTGKDMTIESLSRLGFTEIKVARKLVMEMDNNPNRLDEVKSLVALASSFGFKTTLVGVERREQINLVIDDPAVTNFEGWYFFKPLEINEFLSLLRNSSSKSFLNK